MLLPQRGTSGSRVSRAGSPISPQLLVHTGLLAPELNASSASPGQQQQYQDKGVPVNLGASQESNRNPSMPVSRREVGRAGLSPGSTQRRRLHAFPPSPADSGLVMPPSLDVSVLSSGGSQDYDLSPDLVSRDVGPPQRPSYSQARFPGGTNSEAGKIRGNQAALKGDGISSESVGFHGQSISRSRARARLKMPILASRLSAKDSPIQQHNFPTHEGDQQDGVDSLQDQVVYSASDIPNTKDTIAPIDEDNSESSEGIFHTDKRFRTRKKSSISETGWNAISLLCKGRANQLALTSRKQISLTRSEYQADCATSVPQESGIIRQIR
jgi:hypothetical protein